MGLPSKGRLSWYLFALAACVSLSLLPNGPARASYPERDRLNKSAAKAVQSEAFKKLSVSEGLVLVARPPDELDRYFRDQEEHWRHVIDQAGIKVE
ncbi:hypothetical protein [Bradyrhizobium sp. ARR65]|uniref:hypothetical protein n=1 Tax=Bradyrhizobium sp. ARR65 TaxID=1040989 RepID=UPI000AAE317C|nr:hypothetical protein [Bradyrhizobium sp. ARR65]